MVTRVLLVEDDEAIAELVALILHESGYAVDRVPNVADALDAIACSVPAVILLDLSLLRSGGLSFVRTCRERPELDRVPIVILSGAPHPRLELSLAPAAIVEKPFHVDDLCAIVQQVVRATASVAG